LFGIKLGSNSLFSLWG